MGLPRDIRRATILKRRAQARKNAEALREEEERKEALPGGHYSIEEKILPPPTDLEDKMRRTPAPAVKSVPEPAPAESSSPPEATESLPILEGIRFASDAAERRAMDGRLVAADFEGREPSGVNGFTSADVQAIIEESVG